MRKISETYPVHEVIEDLEDRGFTHVNLDMEDEHAIYFFANGHNGLPVEIKIEHEELTMSERAKDHESWIEFDSYESDLASWQYAS